MGKGSKQLFTCWVPLMDIDLEVGGLCVVEGSSSLPGFQRMRETYGQWDTHFGDHTSTFGKDVNDVRGPGPITSDPEELLRYDAAAKWVTTEYEAGDILIFNMVSHLV